MPEFSSEFWILLLGTLSSGAVIYGGIKNELKNITRRMDSYDEAVERLGDAKEEIAAIRESVKSAHKRLDALEKAIK